MYEEFKIYQHACEDLYRILEETFEEITIADKHGTILFTSKATQTYLFNNNIVGLNVYDLERLGIVNKSAIRLALEQKKRVQFVQTTANKKTLLVTAIPVFDDKKQLIRVISMSNDITEIEKLKVQLTYTENLITTLRKQLRQLKSFEDKIIPSNNARMKKIFTLIKNISNLDSNIMLLGETGTGKSFIAKKIHEFSTRKNYEFVQINCGAIPENLLEAELFGYKEGAFTGAAQKGKVGLIEVAKNGTLFLDEIGDLAKPLQVKLLHVLQEKQFYRLGDTKPIEVFTRIISATNKDIDALVNNGTFREDLYYRLCVIPIYIPPLRERKEDIALFIKMFIDNFNRKYNLSNKISEEAIALLQEYPWPGNIRQLENYIERLLIMAENSIITKKDVENILNANSTTFSKIISKKSLKHVISDFEKSVLLKALKEHKTTHKAAKVLGINQSTLSRKMKKYNITKSSYK